MPQSDTHPLICPECGADVPPGSRFCPDCHVLLANVQQPEKKRRSGGAGLRSKPERDTVIEKDMLNQFNEQRREKSPPPKRREPKPRGPKPLSKASPEELKLVSAELLTENPSPGKQKKRKATKQKSRQKAKPVRAPVDVEPPVPARQTTPPPAEPARQMALVPRTDVVPRNSAGRTVALVAAELEDALDGTLQAWGEMVLADRISICAVVGLLISTLLPWYHNSMGVLSGGSLLWLFSSATIALIVLRRAKQLKEQKENLDASLGRPDTVGLRRLNLLQILVGVGAVLYLVVLVFALYVGDPSRFELSFGWYVAVFFAMGLAYSGIARFIRDVHQHSRDR